MAENTAGNGVGNMNFRDGITAPDSYPRMPVIDYDYYLTFLEESDAPIEQKYELIEILFNIMMGFADIAFGINPTQNTCGQLPKIDSERHIPALDVVNSKDQTTTRTFTKAAKGGHE